MKRDGKRKHRSRWEINIKMNLKEILVGSEDVDWIFFAQNREQFWGSCVYERREIF
jgi:hypothetical protein